ncbi:hypothetical protein [Asanoa iriomotensis]|uniref:2',3'-cyclic-nucleotide 2'-phosphodiesterase (5'-nucleotidase family) n=1 Tax=Asanoa iriomotensis TaxID=234613 RepID=A0ABQ4C5E7_9ACTN|nr:hypothetical protein [Asanoa iriomotensis]GIF58005.1 hypothetical protein Air01nite_41000 [Asanoa iriomotensis]
MSTTIIATCDFHSSVLDGRTTVAALARWRKAGALIIDAGDFFGGNAFHEWSRGHVEETILTTFYDAVIPGNHDMADLMRLRTPGLFPPIVCCNLTPPGAFGGRWESNLLLTVGDLRVGMVGFVGAQAFGAVPVDEREGFGFTEPTPELLAVEADGLLGRGADVVVGVSHSGFDHDVALQRAGVPFPVIIAGHCHSEQYLWSSKAKHVAKAPELGAGLLRIELHRGGVRSFAIEHHPPGGRLAVTAGEEEFALIAMIAEYERWSSEVVGTLVAPIPDRKAVAHAVAARARQVSATDAFVINVFAFRAGLPARVTRGALADAAPFDTALVRLTGERRAADVVELIRRLGEEPVVAPSVGGSGGVATTAYLADRLGLPYEPVEPRSSVRSVITSLFGSLA